MLENTRERIRSEALTLFIAKGYGRTSIAEIETAAGLAPRAGGFYRHFVSKAELAAEIGETSIIETRADLGFDGVLPLGDTRAELILIARGYARAMARQAPLAGLIAEIQHLPKIQELQNRVDRDLMQAFNSWLRDKRYADGMSADELDALVLSIFGGWIFYMFKRQHGSEAVEMRDEAMLSLWADLWSRILDQPR